VLMHSGSGAIHVDPYVNIYNKSNYPDSETGITPLAIVRSHNVMAGNLTRYKVICVW